MERRREDECMERSMNGWREGKKDGRMGRRMDKGTEGWKDEGRERKRDGW